MNLFLDFFSFLKLEYVSFFKIFFQPGVNTLKQINFQIVAAGHRNQSLKIEITKINSS